MVYLLKILDYVILSNLSIIERFFKVMNIAWKFYLPIHAVPTLIFQFKLLKTA
jgi:hypothetical protein